MRLCIVATEKDRSGNVINYMDNISNENWTYYHKEQRTGIWHFYSSYTLPGETTPTVRTANPFTYTEWTAADGIQTGLTNSFNPAHSVYLKITAARRPTHESN